MIKRDNIRIENPRVGGSIPPLATMFSLVKSWCYPKINHFAYLTLKIHCGDFVGQNLQKS